jgi:hypothetical protein
MILTTHWIQNNLTPDEQILFYHIITDGTTYKFHDYETVQSIKMCALQLQFINFDTAVLTDEGQSLFEQIKSKLVEFGIFHT